MARTKNFAEYIQSQMDADPELALAVEEEAINAHIAQQVYDLRTAAGLSQKELAEQIGTKQSVISRIEDADYEGHSLGILKRIADALNKKLEVKFCDRVAEKPTGQQAGPFPATATAAAVVIIQIPTGGSVGVYTTASGGR